MRIGIDIDDTISDTETAFLPFEKKYDDSIGGQGILYETKRYWNKYNWNEKQIEAFKNIYLLEILKYTKPVEKARKNIQKLKDEGHEIIFITARSDGDEKTNYDLTKTWLDKFNFPFDKLIVGALKKGEICQNEKIDFFIDDSISQCMDVMKHTNAKVICFNPKEQTTLETLNNWDDIYNMIKTS